MARFIKGMPRPANAGRKKGSLNKKKLKKVSEILAENGVHPATELMKLVNQNDIDPKEVAGIWKELLTYCEAKPKEIEIIPEEPEPDELDELPDAALLQMVKDPEAK